MSKKDFFNEKTSPELDAQILKRVESILEIKSNNLALKKRRSFLIWTSLSSAAAAVSFIWIKSWQESNDPAASLQLAEDLTDDNLIALEDLNLDLEDEALENLEIIEDWSEIDG